MTNHNPAEQPQGVDTASIPHTGKLEGPMQELPTQEFDKTSLAEAHEQNLLTIPDSVALWQDNHEEVKKGSSKKAVLGGVAAAGAIAIGVAGFALGSSGEEDPANTDGKSVVVDNTEEDNSINTPPSETTITVEGSGEMPATNSEESPVDRDFGNVGLDEIDSGDDYIVATRMNGEEIHIPKLDMSGLENGETTRFANTALSLFACYMTTGDQACLDAFSPVPEIQSMLTSARQQGYGDIISDASNENWQLAIFDTPENPVKFTSEEDGAGYAVSIDPNSGPLYARMYGGFYGSTEWQNPETRLNGSEASNVIDLFSVRVEERNGTPVITRIDFNIS